MKKEMGAPTYEYACSEGNYGIANILRGARGSEKALPAGKTATE